MERIFRAQKMIDRVKREGRAELLDGETMAMITKLDGKVGTDYNWEAVVQGEPLVWIPADKDQDGTYVAVCDCD